MCIRDRFNYSAINNYGAKFATGEYILLLNNDTEVISADWIQEMLMFAQRTDVGAVGAKLYYFEDVYKRQDMRYAIDPTFIHEQLGWLPATKFSDGIQRTIEWYLNNRSWWEEIVNGDYQNYYERMYAGR